jgi:malonyl-CoA/methylmalonyl-CoA synthetase
VPDEGQSVSDVDIITFCKANIANFKVPKAVMVVDELPRNAMGKVQKNVLRERFSDSCS